MQSVKYFDWNKEKNTKLIAQRGVSFEEVVIAIEEGYLLDAIKHPDKNKYPGQKIFIVQIQEYVYLVPFIEDDSKVFLKTIIPSRKATKKYIIMKGKKL